MVTIEDSSCYLLSLVLPVYHILLTYAITIVRNKEYCLIYNRLILKDGLLWKDLRDWWHEDQGPSTSKLDLFERLYQSLDSEPEKLIFKSYIDLFAAEEMPALIPQVYLHYDPYTKKQLLGNKNLERQRMDFLLLLPNHIRVVIEVDGKQHYSKQDSKGQHIASSQLYANMVSEDRKLKLAGYDLYRFGGFELQGQKGITLASDFFKALFRKHEIYNP